MKKQIPERFHPGEYIEEERKARGMSLVELALTMDIRPLRLGRLRRGEESVDGEVAKKLAKVFGIGTKVWLNLQRAYEEERK